MAVTRYGKTNWEQGFDNGSKTRTFAEQGTFDVDVTGDYSTLRSEQPKPGGSISADLATKWGLPSAGTDLTWAVRNTTLTGEEGGMGNLKVSLVAVASDGSFDTTYDVEMREVQKSLKTHPIILGTSGALTQIQMWEATPENIRKFESSSGIAYRYYRTTVDDPVGVLTTMTNTAAIAYANAVSAGIETYNVYLPVVTRTRHYMNLPGTAGTSITYEDDIGKFDTPPIQLSGYPVASPNYNWFKSADKFSRANDGSWTRTEEWTYTNDTTHHWIYQTSLS